MKALFLVEEPPLPADTGAKLRAYNLVKEASVKHEIVLACPCAKLQDCEKLSSAFGGRIRIEPFPISNSVGKSGLALVKRVAKNLFTPDPVIIDTKRNVKIGTWITELVKKGPFDVFHCDSIYVCSPQLGRLGLPSVFDAHNVEAMIWERYASSASNPLMKLFWTWQLGKIKKTESKLAQWFDVAAAVSAEDMQQLMSRYEWKSCITAPNAVDLDYYSVEALPDNNSIIFIGSLDWRPNQDAVSYMISDILPIIRMKKPDLTLKIVGRRPPEWMSQLCKANNVELCQDVPDVRPYLIGADLSVVPLRIGGGSRLKILESFAAGRAVVSTTVGAEGIDSSIAARIADDPESFAQTVCTLLDDKSELTRMGEAGRKLVEERYSWEQSALHLERAWQEAIDIH